MSGIKDKAVTIHKLPEVPEGIIYTPGKRGLYKCQGCGLCYRFRKWAKRCLQEDLNLARQNARYKIGDLVKYKAKQARIVGYGSITRQGHYLTYQYLEPNSMWPGVWWIETFSESEIKNPDKHWVASCDFAELGNYPVNLPPLKLFMSDEHKEASPWYRLLVIFQSMPQALDHQGNLVIPVIWYGRDKELGKPFYISYELCKSLTNSLELSIPRFKIGDSFIDQRITYQITEASGEIRTPTGMPCYVCKRLGGMNRVSEIVISEAKLGRLSR